MPLTCESQNPRGSSGMWRLHACWKLHCNPCAQYWLLRPEPEDPTCAGLESAVEVAWHFDSSGIATKLLKSWIQFLKLCRMASRKNDSDTPSYCSGDHVEYLYNNASSCISTCTTQVRPSSTSNCFASSALPLLKITSFPRSSAQSSRLKDHLICFHASDAARFHRLHFRALLSGFGSGPEVQAE